MAFDAFAANPGLLRLILLLVGFFLGAVAVVLHSIRRARAEALNARLRAGIKDNAAAVPVPQTAPPLQDSIKATPPQLRFDALADRPSLFMDLIRAALILLAFLVAGGWILVALPYSAVDRLATGLLPRNIPAPPPDKLALLYLGDEVKNKEFHIRGVVQNVYPEPLMKTDASIRLYAPDGSLLETAVVRMDYESIAPGMTAQFNLSYPRYDGQFGSYSVDFKTRQGDLVPYKDMRAARAQS